MRIALVCKSKNVNLNDPSRTGSLAWNGSEESATVRKVRKAVIHLKNVAPTLMPFAALRSRPDRQSSAVDHDGGNNFLLLVTGNKCQV